MITATDRTEPALLSAEVDPQWQRLGRLLIQRRIEMSPRYRQRKVFSEATGLNARLLYDIERARRTTFPPETLAAFEVAYRFAPGSIERFLNGGDLTPLDLPAPGPPRTGEDLVAEIGTRMLRRGASEEEVASLAERLHLPRRRPTDLRTVEWRLVADALGVSLGTALIEFGVAEAAELAPGSPPPPPAQQRDRTRRRA